MAGIILYKALNSKSQIILTVDALNLNNYTNINFFGKFWKKRSFEF
jgi:hypothetical protein